VRICIINPYYDAASETILEVTGRYRHVEALSSALSRRGHQVTVIQSFQDDRTECRSGVQFRYVQTPQRSAFHLSGGPLGIDLLFPSNLKGIISALAQFEPYAVHMNGLTLLQPLASIAAWCGKRNRPLTVSHHGGIPRRAPWLRSTHRRALSSCRGVFFTTEAHAEPWISAGVLRREKVVTCMEVSSTFAPADRSSARARTGMHGAPVFVWNALLHKGKDPLTALRGFSLIRRQWGEARLYMIYVSNEMQSEVQQAIAANPLLRDAVELRGRIPPDAVETFLNSADFIIQSSRSEVAGYSVLEAMACGVIPVVSDIPSFRAMTDGGRYGVLFPIGRHELIAERVLALDPGNLSAVSRDVRAYFVQALSYDAIAEIYERTMVRR
jgi:glycosyltransferase involved in cell wall biosynthesis